MNNINNSVKITFKGRIIDMHTHVGKWGNVVYNKNNLDTFINSQLENGDTITKMIISNLDCINKENIKDEIIGNSELIENIKSNPKYSALAVCQPNITQGNTKKLEELFKNYPNSFVGLKFHPKIMELPANYTQYDNYIAFAQKHNLPCLFHSDMTFDIDYGCGNIVKKCQYSRPEQIYQLAKRHPKTPIILGHMGGISGENCKAAIDIIVDSIENSSANLYADISWVNPDTTEKPDIISAIKRLKNTTKGDQTNRLLWGTDAPLGRFSTIEKNLTPQQSYQKVINDIKSEIRRNFPTNEADELIEKIFYKNANNLFFNKKINKKTTTNKYLVIASIFIAILTAVTTIILNNKNTQKTSDFLNQKQTTMPLQNNKYIFEKFHKLI